MLKPLIRVFSEFEFYVKMVNSLAGNLLSVFDLNWSNCMAFQEGN